MMNNKTFAEQDEKIQQLSVADLNNMFEKASAITVETVSPPLQEKYSEEEEVIQNMPLSQLKKLVEKEFSNASIDEKITKTGLSETAIRQIESNKYNATLKEIIAYCRGLKIRFQDFVPEFFTS